MGLGPFSSRPVAVSPPFWGWVCFGGLTGVVVHLRDAWRGFPRWVGLLAALLEVYLSFSSSLFLGRVPRLLRLFSPGGRVVVSEAGLAVRVSLLAASLPLPMVFPWRWGHGVRLYLLGWFAILEVLVLKSRFSPFLMVSSLLAWCLEFWAPVPVAPLPREALWFFSSLCGVRADIWPRASVSLPAFDLLVAWSLRLWGDPCLGVQWLSFRGAGVVSFASSC